MFYAGAETPRILPTTLPCLQHLASSTDLQTEKSEGMTLYKYPAIKSTRFAIPGLDSFEYASDAVAHTRNLTFLKRHIRGADFDLEAIWEEHTYWEFENRSVPKTMGTMVQEPYVNHIPTVIQSNQIVSLFEAVS